MWNTCPSHQSKNLLLYPTVPCISQFLISAVATITSWCVLKKLRTIEMSVQSEGSNSLHLRLQNGRCWNELQLHFQLKRYKQDEIEKWFPLGVSKTSRNPFFTPPDGVLLSEMDVSADAVVCEPKDVVKERISPFLNSIFKGVKALTGPQSQSHFQHLIPGIFWSKLYEQVFLFWTTFAEWLDAPEKHDFSNLHKRFTFLHT